MPIPESVTTKPSKAPLYAEALRLFLSDPNLTLPQIAERVGLRADTLIANAERQSWHKRRAIVDKDASETRIVAASKVDSRLVDATMFHVEQMTDEWQAITSKVITLSTTPDAAETDAKELMRQRYALLERKASLMQSVSKGYIAMIEAAASMGLVKGVAKDLADGKLDMGKLTQLNLAINVALGESGEKRVIELEDTDVI